jgi:hypothetical protein
MCNTMVRFVRENFGPIAAWRDADHIYCRLLAIEPLPWGEFTLKLSTSAKERPAVMPVSLPIRPR